MPPHYFAWGGGGGGGQCPRKDLVTNGAIHHNAHISPSVYCIIMSSIYTLCDVGTLQDGGSLNLR